MPKNDSTKSSTENSTLAVFITPVLYAAICILFSLGLTISLNHHPYMHWNVLVAAFATVTLALGFFPRQSIPYAALLWIWCFWLAMRTALSDYWNFVDQGVYTPIPFHLNIYRLSVALHVLFGWLTFARRFRGFYTVLAISLLVVLNTALVPKPRPNSEYLALAQSIAYVLLYMFSNVVVELYALNEGRTANAAIKILQSSWVLLVEDALVITIVTALQALMSVAVLWNYADDLDKVYAVMRRPMDASVYHAGVLSEGKHKSSRSDSESPSKINV